MADPDRVQLRAGRLHITSATYDRLFAGCVALALRELDGGQWILLPLRGGAGGLQIKLRNARGDRVVESQEFFRQQGLEDSHEPRELELAYEPGLGGFRLR